MVIGGKGQATISVESEAKLILVSASVPLVQLKVSCEEPAETALTFSV